MDFEGAAQRLRKDQSKLRGKRDLVVSQKAKRQAEFQRKQAARLRAEREQKRRLEECQKRYMHECDRFLQVKPLGRASNNNSLLLTPTSIFGEGDKIALSPSVLELLTSTAQTNVGDPWTFRIGILNPEYQFPASPLIQTMKPPKDDEEDAMDDSDEEQEDDLTAYNDEMSSKYLAFTHCTVVEFTQDEGHVGIPQPIAKALLEPNKKNSGKVPVKRTVDPAGSASNTEDSMEIEEEQEQTPGHLAWGAFDIPDMQLEISLLKLPKGTGCTLVPSKEAIQSGFYDLKDVKLVLEQSLIRTRATLTVGDTVSTWHRGVRYDLNVRKVIPSSYNSITCINTDIEVDIGEPEDAQKEKASQPPPEPEKSTDSGYKLGTGQTLVPVKKETNDVKETPSFEKLVNLLQEPPEDQKEGVCLIQIQHSGGRGKRRFTIKEARLSDLFAYASTLVKRNDFQLVTRYPRRVLTNENDPSVTLEELGIQPGQERFMVEFL